MAPGLRGLGGANLDGTRSRTHCEHQDSKGHEAGHGLTSRTAAHPPTRSRAQHCNDTAPEDLGTQIWNSEDLRGPLGSIPDTKCAVPEPHELATCVA